MNAAVLVVMVLQIHIQVHLSLTQVVVVVVYKVIPMLHWVALAVAAMVVRQVLV
jgi:hypothetical protein